MQKRAWDPVLEWVATTYGAALNQTAGIMPVSQSDDALKAIDKAQANPVDSEELIKYGHRISASNAVSAPLSWQQGDPRRPYPTDMEMRLGCLAR